MLLLAVNGDRHKDSQLFKAQRIRDFRILIPKWDNYIIPSPVKAQESLWERWWIVPCILKP